MKRNVRMVLRKLSGSGRGGAEVLFGWGCRSDRVAGNVVFCWFTQQRLGHYTLTFGDSTPLGTHVMLEVFFLFSHSFIHSFERQSDTERGLLSAGPFPKYLQ